MKIQGLLTIEGFNLHVHIDAPDDLKDIFVTDLPPHALVITRERLRIDSLRFPSEVIESLQERGVRFLSDLVNSRWELQLQRVKEEHRAIVEAVLKQFLDAALLPFVGVVPDHIPTVDSLADDARRLEALRQKLTGETGPPVPAPDEKESERAAASLPAHSVSMNGQAKDIAILGLPAGVTKELREKLGVYALDDFAQKGISRRALASLRYGSTRMTQRIVDGLAQHGLELPNGSLTDES